MPICLLHHYTCACIPASADWNGIVATVVADGIVLAYAVFLSFQARGLRGPVIWLQVRFLSGKFLGWDTVEAVVHRAVARALKPRQALGVQLVYAGELAPAEEVVLYILDGVLNLTFALRVGLAAENSLEMLLADKGAEAFGKCQITEVLVV